MASTYPNRHYQWGAQNGGQKSNEFPSRPGPESASPGRRSSTARRRTASRSRYYNSDLPFAALYGPRGLAWTKPVSTFYADAAAGTLPQHLLRRPAVPRRRRRQRPLGRRAPARRHPPRPGVHVGRRPRVHRVAAVRARRDVRQLRRVGRLLRPRRAAVRPRRPPQPGRHRERLEPDGLPHPGRRDLARSRRAARSATCR